MAQYEMMFTISASEAMVSNLLKKEKIFICEKAFARFVSSKISVEDREESFHLGLRSIAMSSSADPSYLLRCTLRF